ncbi:hypothetical protein ACMWH5_09635, partial [Klebsiella pneumoniae]
MKGVVFREIIAIRDGKNHNAMKGRSLADFVTGRIKSAKECRAFMALWFLPSLIAIISLKTTPFTGPGR